MPESIAYCSVSMVCFFICSRSCGFPASVREPRAMADTSGPFFPNFLVFIWYILYAHKNGLNNNTRKGLKSRDTGLNVGLRLHKFTAVLLRAHACAPFKKLAEKRGVGKVQLLGYLRNIKFFYL
jgi:hypothetical protein